MIFLPLFFTINIYAQDDLNLIAKVKIYSDNKSGKVFTQIIKSTNCDHYDSLAIIESYNRASITPFKGKTFNLNTIYEIVFNVPKDTFILCSPHLKNIPREIEATNNFEFRLCIPEYYNGNSKPNIKPDDFNPILIDDYKVYFVSPTPILTVDDLKDIEIEKDTTYNDDLYNIHISLKSSESQKFFDFTKNNLTNHLGLFIEGNCIICPIITSALKDKMRITQLNYEGAQLILNKFNSLKIK